VSYLRAEFMKPSLRKDRSSVAKSIVNCFRSSHFSNEFEMQNTYKNRNENQHNKTKETHFFEI
ncbi:hypothetical protein L9F63_023786, partial [Diploptera punctata]